MLHLRQLLRVLRALALPGLPEAGQRSLRSTVPPGPLGEMHAYDTIEQIYVIAGGFYDDDANYGPGDFVLRMPGTMHRAGSHEGCTMLLVYAPLVSQ